MARKKKQVVDDESAGVMDRLTALLTLFKSWSNNGVPPGIVPPKSLNEVRPWTSPEHGILVGIGSKRDIVTTHPTYGTRVEELQKLIKVLKPTKAKPKRVAKTAKAQKVAAEDTRDEYKLRLEGVTKQLSEKEYQLEVAQRELIAEQQRTRNYRTEVDKLNETVARLTRELSLKSGGLKVVN